MGHTGPVTCVQFDETHLVSGSLDKTIRVSPHSCTFFHIPRLVLTFRTVQIWDLRTGSISETIRYSQAITALQFDSRKIVAAAGENGVRVRPRLSLSFPRSITD